MSAVEPHVAFSQRTTIPVRPWPGTPLPVGATVLQERFYFDTVCRLVGEGWLAGDPSVLVVAGGAVDREVLLAAGLRRVTVSNVDDRMRGDEFAPFGWSRQDAEDLTCADDSFDVCIAHLGLHHCRSPHRALLEMYRVARRGVLFFEPQDTLLTRLGVRLGAGQQYEVAAVGGNGLRYGGVRNTEIPNFVYRWTEREVRKAVASFDPVGVPRVRCFYGLAVPNGRLDVLPTPVRALVRGAVVPAVRALVSVAPAQANIVGVVIDKLDRKSGLHPWLTADGDRLVPDAAWFAAHFGRLVRAGDGASDGDDQR